VIYCNSSEKITFEKFSILVFTCILWKSNLTVIFWISISVSAQFNCFQCSECEYLNRDQVDRVQCGEGVTETTTIYTGPPTDPPTVTMTPPLDDSDTTTTELPTASGAPTNPPAPTLSHFVEDETTTVVVPTTVEARRQGRNLEMFQSTHRCFAVRLNFSKLSIFLK
jgi:hypothetical protein